MKRKLRIFGVVLGCCLGLFCGIFPGAASSLEDSAEMKLHFVTEESHADSLAMLVMNCHAETELLCGFKAAEPSMPIYFCYDKVTTAHDGYVVHLSSMMSREECVYRIVQAILLRDFCPTSVSRFEMNKVEEMDWLVSAIVCKVLHGNVLNTYSDFPHPFRLYNFYSCHQPLEIGEWMSRRVRVSAMPGYRIYALNNLYLLRYARNKISPQFVKTWLTRWGRGEAVDVLSRSLFYQEKNSEAQGQRAFNLSMMSFLFMNAAISNIELAELVEKLEYNIKWCQENSHEIEKIQVLREEMQCFLGNLSLNSQYRLKSQQALQNYRNVAFHVLSNLHNESYMKQYRATLDELRAYLIWQKHVSQWLNRYEITHLSLTESFPILLQTKDEMGREEISERSKISEYLIQVEKTIK